MGSVRKTDDQRIRSDASENAGRCSGTNGTAERGPRKRPSTMRIEQFEVRCGKREQHRQDRHDRKEVFLRVRCTGQTTAMVVFVIRRGTGKAMLLPGRVVPAKQRGGLQCANRVDSRQRRQSPRPTREQQSDRHGDRHRASHVPRTLFPPGQHDELRYIMFHIASMGRLMAVRGRLWAR